MGDEICEIVRSNFCSICEILNLVQLALPADLEKNSSLVLIIFDNINEGKSLI